eukprot:gene2733-3158_t
MVLNNTDQAVVEPEVTETDSTTAKEAEEIICLDEATEVTEPSKYKKDGRRGAKNRRSYDNDFKFKIIEEAKHNQKNDVPVKYAIDQSLVRKWVKKEKKILEAAVDKHRKILKKIRPSTKHRKVFVKLHEKFLKARSKGLKVSYSWLYINAKINIELNPADAKPIPKSAILNFIRKCKINLRRIQRKKQKDKRSFLPGMLNWHVTLREVLIKSGASKASYDSKWGRFKPNQRFLHRPGALTTQAYHKDVNVYWQANAWADTAFCVDWVKKTLKPAVEKDGAGNEEFVLFCDNLNAQSNELFCSEVRKINGIVWYGVAGATDIGQPVDCGFGSMLKSMTFTIQDEWLEDDENIDLWLDNSEQKLDVKQRKILITHWVGEAVKHLSSNSYAKSRHHCFEKTVCLITAGGSEDEKIQPEGLPGYKLPPQLQVAAGENHIECPPQEVASPPEDVDIASDEELEPTEDEAQERIDEVNAYKYTIQPIEYTTMT